MCFHEIERKVTHAIKIFTELSTENDDIVSMTPEFTGTHGC